jgi:hypothetical protein
MQSRPQLLTTIIEATCNDYFDQHTIEVIINNLVEKQEQFGEKFKDYDWIQNNIVVQAPPNVAESKEELEELQPQFIFTLTGWEIEFIQSVLTSLDTRLSDTKTHLRKAILDYYAVDPKLDGSEFLILQFLKEVGLLPAIQYAVCTSLITGGHDGGELTLSVAIKLLKNARLTLDALIENFSILSPYQLACEQDNPEILLTVFGVTEKFILEHLITASSCHNNFLEMLAYNKKNKILTKIIRDLPALDLVRIQYLDQSILEAKDVNLAASCHAKLAPLGGVNGFNLSIQELLNCLQPFIKKMIAQAHLSSEMQAFAQAQLKAIEVEKGREIFMTYDAIFKNFEFLMLKCQRGLILVHEDDDNGEREALISSHHFLNNHPHETFGQRYLQSKKKKLELATNLFQRSLELSIQEEAGDFFDGFSVWLEELITYSEHSQHDKANSLYKHDRSLLEAQCALDFFLKIQISQLAFLLYMKSIPDFLDDLFFQTQIGMQRFAMQQCTKLQDLVFLGFIKFIETEAKQTVLSLTNNPACTEQKMLAIKRWGLTKMELAKVPNDHSELAVRELSKALILKLNLLRQRVKKPEVVAKDLSFFSR